MGDVYYTLPLQKRNLFDTSRCTCYSAYHSFQTRLVFKKDFNFDTFDTWKLFAMCLLPPPSCRKPVWSGHTFCS